MRMISITVNVQVMSLITPIQKQKSIDKFQDSGSAALQTRSGDRVGLVCCLYIRVHSTHVNRVMSLLNTRGFTCLLGAIKKP